MTRSFDDEFDRRLEHEPDYRGHHSPAKLDGAGTLQSLLGVLPVIPLAYQHNTIEKPQLCTVCERSVATPGRCDECTGKDRRRVECSCCWLAANESCACGEAA